MKRNKNARWFLVALIIYLTLVFVISHMSASSFRLQNQFLWDKSCHFIEYIPVGFLLVGWLIHRRPTKANGFLFVSLQALAILMLLSAADEMHQSFIPSRHPSFLDAIADTLGGSVGISIGLFLSRRRANPSQSETTS